MMGKKKASQCLCSPLSSLSLFFSLSPDGDLPKDVLDSSALLLVVLPALLGKALDQMCGMLCNW
jgi:hypothetical protein